MTYIEKPSPNFDARTRPIDLVVLHYTGMQNADIALKRLTDPTPKAGDYPGPWQREDVAPDAPLSRVSSHYVVDEVGQVFSLVPEEHRAWHAGASSWEGEGDVNARSIGIEIVNGGHDFGVPDFTEPQIAAVIGLLRDIFSRWPGLNAKRVVAHSDIAPERKSDPGEKFPWKRLAAEGVSIWPRQVPEHVDGDDPVSRAQTDLGFIGYDVKQTGSIDELTKAALAAFQRRFRQSNVDGELDDETLALIVTLARQLAVP